MTTNQSRNAMDFLEGILGKKPTLGDYLLAIRQGEEQTQIEFAKNLGISRQNLCDIEHNRRFVSPRVAAQFAENLGYSKNQFVRLCLQDLLKREGLSLSVDIHSDAA
jgi:transcriptional regulator with XRE-family HTH domain